MQKISPFLWFNDQAEEAMEFYTGIFRHSRPGTVMRYGDAGPGAKGSVMSVSFELEGQEFMAINGGPHFAFTPAISFFIKCATQEEVDDYWDKLSAGGTIQQCGWLQDRFGVSWQVVPVVLGELLQDPDPVRSARVMQAMMNMVKLDIDGLQRAYAG
ncbi:VOC family protein [Cupriavidus necator]|uniref:VOC family protein n=1 Tax=Cupriavidus necator TaxID=106590 RepID=UPI00339D43D7